ncbi:hypothetical protein EVAR_85293_1 [Eumeta japonica]|uniref:Uncharacterized protein n=1 Tax=Eumeta variegata TaxID=151549 RepID=A0A4C1V6Y7_EUMVA|nr:hypothetical protein EVAR_85293_1 [Eumeta japonica]
MKQSDRSSALYIRRSMARVRSSGDVARAGWRKLSILSAGWLRSINRNFLRGVHKANPIAAGACLPMRSRAGAGAGRAPARARVNTLT